MEPLMCPFCGGTEIVEEEGSKIELDEGYWIIPLELFGLP